MSFTGQYKIRSIPQLRTGLNDRNDASEIADTDMADCQNIEVNTKLIRNAAGYVDYGGATGPFWGGFHAKFENGTNRLIRQRGAKLEYDNGAGTWTECTLPTTGSPAATVTLSQLPCSFAMLNDTVLWSNGTDTVMSSANGITWTLQASLPKSKVLFNNGLNRILFMAQTAAPSRVDWSDINDPVTVGGTSYQFIGKNDGQEIIDAVLMPNGAILLFKTNRFYSISDITFDMTAVDPIGDAPCVRYTAQATENSAIWAGPDGKIYEFDGNRANLISGNITPLTCTKPASMRGIYFNNKYRLAVPNGSDAFNSYEYVVDRKLTTGDPMNPYVITKNQRYIGCFIREDREVSGIRRSRLYFGDGRASAVGSPAAVPTTFVYVNDEHDTGVTQGLNGAAQTCTFTTKFFTEDVPFIIKRYTKYFLQLKGAAAQTITISYRTDQNAQWTDTSYTTSSTDLDWSFSDGSSGGFSDGYSFAYSVTEDSLKDLEISGVEPRGIQFKLTWSSITDIEILSQAFKFLIKTNMR